MFTQPHALGQNIMAEGVVVGEVPPHGTTERMWMKQNVCPSLLSTLPPSIPSRYSAHGMVLPIMCRDVLSYMCRTRTGLPTSLMLSGHTLTDTPRVVFY
jgi:hypothetical protein